MSRRAGCASVLKIIRASSLPTYNDCARMASASVLVQDEKGQERLLPELFDRYKINPKKRGRRAHLGTAFHAAMEYIMRQKITKLEWTYAAAAIAMEQALVEGFDDTDDDKAIPDVETGMRILNNMLTVASIRADELDPVATELELEMLVTRDTILRGHTDLLAKARCSDGIAVHDWKSSGAAVPKPYTSQIGGYANLARANGYEVEEGYTETVRTLKRKESQLITTAYDVIEASKFAQATVERFSANIDRYVGTADPNSFNANPSSSLCSQKFCPVWGTDYCTVGRAA